MAHPSGRATCDRGPLSKNGPFLDFCCLALARLNLVYYRSRRLNTTMRYIIFTVPLIEASHAQAAVSGFLASVWHWSRMARWKEGEGRMGPSSSYDHFMWALLGFDHLSESILSRIQWTEWPGHRFWTQLRGKSDFFESDVCCPALDSDSTQLVVFVSWW